MSLLWPMETGKDTKKSAIFQFPALAPLTPPPALLLQPSIQ
jgi:hypothetical protein